MLEIHKLDHVYLVARVLQHRRADGVGQQGADALPDDAVLQQQIQLAAFADG